MEIISMAKVLDEEQCFGSGSYEEELCIHIRLTLLFFFQEGHLRSRILQDDWEDEGKPLSCGVPNATGIYSKVPLLLLGI